MPYYYGSDDILLDKKNSNSKNLIKYHRKKNNTKSKSDSSKIFYQKQKSFYYSDFYFFLRGIFRIFRKQKIILPFSFSLQTILTIFIIFFVSGSLIFVAFSVSDYFKINTSEKVLKLPYSRTYFSEFKQNISTSEIKNIYLSAGGEDVVLTPVKYFDYQVSSGDSLWTIAKKFQISVDAIYSANISKMKNPHILTAGMILRIPTNMGIVKEVKSIDDVDKLLNQFDIDELSLFISNGVSTKEELVGKKEIFLPNVELPQSEKLQAYGIAFKFPTYGYISSRFGYRRDPFTGLRRFHSGVDISNVWGSPIFAAYDGVVVFVGEKGGYGLCIIISHPLGYSTLYGHLSKTLVKVGQSVSKGSKIALMGSSGRSTGSHLHFEIRKFNKCLNPLSYTVFK